MLRPAAPHYLFIPQDTKRLKEYERGCKVTEMFPVNILGMTTGQDAKTVAFDHKGALKLAELLAVPPTCIEEILYRPFDIRRVTY